MNKIRRYACKSLKEHNKIIRKYIKYFKNNYIYSTYWYVWCWVDIIGLDALNDKYLTLQANKQAAIGLTNLKHIIQTIKNNYNWSFEHKNGKIYYLQGLEISNEDFYYIYVAEDGSKLYNSCVGRFTDIECYKK